MKKLALMALLCASYGGVFAFTLGFKLTDEHDYPIVLMTMGMVAFFLSVYVPMLMKINRLEQEFRDQQDARDLGLFPFDIERKQ